MADAAEGQHVLVIGIDFGTTYSGISWAYSGQPDDINVVTQWESVLNYNNDLYKCPTRIYFNPRTGGATWGYGIADTREALKWFKLLLIDEGDLSPELRHSAKLAEARGFLLKANKTPLEVTTLYLRVLWNHALASIRRQLGQDMVDLCAFRVIITLPAIWPLYAQEKMRCAARQGGILEQRSTGGVAETTLAFISEPEAAALATLRDMVGRPTIQVDDHFVVCDAGGGTVDLISYAVQGVKPFTVRESVKGSGGLCGAVFLDEKFVDMVKEKVTPEAWETLSMANVRKVMNDDWEHGIKPQFDGQDRNWVLHMPPMLKVSTKAGGGKKSSKRARNLTLNKDDLISVFNPVAAKILGLVLGQINKIKSRYDKKPKYVILVGGFGRCRYLFKYLEAALDTGIAVLQSPGDKPWTAICRGAVVSGLTGQGLTSSKFSVNIGSRIARASYGTAFSTKWKNDGNFREKDRYWDAIENCYKAINQMRWFLSQGDDVSEKQPVSHTFYYLYKVTEIPESVETTVWYSLKSPAPSRKNKSVNKVCSIRWEPRHILPSLRPSLGKGNANVYRVEFTVEMVCSGVSLEFSVRHNKQKLASENVTVDFGGEDSTANRRLDASGFLEPAIKEEEVEDDDGDGGETSGSD